jgi:hypothetical protein
MFDRVKMLAAIIAYSVRTAAESTKINERALRRMLMGRRKCGLEEYVRICGYLGAPLDEFIKEDEETLWL